MTQKKIYFDDTVHWIKDSQRYKANQIKKADYLFLMGLFETDELTFHMKYDDWFLSWIRE